MYNRGGHAHRKLENVQYISLDCYVCTFAGRRVIMERLRQTYSPEILAVMKMSNIEGLKQHYRCHKDKRAKTVKTMASVTGMVNIQRNFLYLFNAHRCKKKNYKHLWFAIVTVFWLHTLLWLA